MNEDNEIELCDFGISRVLNGTSSAFTTKGSTTSCFAPLEYLLDPTRYSTALDVYSFGFLILAVSPGVGWPRSETQRLINHFQILSDRIPFEGLSSAAVILKIARGERPHRAEYQLSLDSRAVDEIWTLMDSCWSSREEIRPTMATIIQEVRTYHSTGTHSS